MSRNSKAMARTKWATAADLKAAEVEGRGIRVLTVRQPWAWAIICSSKDVENRSQPINLRATVAVHAGAADPGPVLQEWDRRWGPKPDSEELVRGAVIGVVDIVGCRQDSRSKWAFPGEHHWLLANPRRLRKPIPATGKLGFWYQLSR